HQRVLLERDWNERLARSAIEITDRFNSASLNESAKLEREWSERMEAVTTDYEAEVAHLSVERDALREEHERNAAELAELHAERERSDAEVARLTAERDALRQQREQSEAEARAERERSDAEWNEKMTTIVAHLASD